MGNHNSQYECYAQILHALFRDVGSTCGYRNQLSLDLATAISRFRSEGISFLTQTLPKLGKSVDRALAQDTPLQFHAFKRRKGTKLPLFMWTLVSELFDSDGRPIQPTADVGNNSASSYAPAGKTPAENAERRAAVLRCIRQICYAFYKLDIPYTDEKEQKVIDSFVETERELGTLHLDHDSSILKMARNLLRRVLANLDPCSGIPKHGPGSVATGELSAEKHMFSRYYELLAREFPYDEWFFLNHSHLAYSLDRLDRFESIDAGTAKVVLVPKDSRGPRLISAEPLEYQWIQQALMQVMVTGIESHPWTKGHVNFTDQSINRELARRSSQLRDYATLDMKEASDRVSWDLVQYLFPLTWVEKLYASRTQSTRLPDGRQISLNKFAPMGSAVCFPVEAIVFWSICVATIHIKCKRPLAEAIHHVYVYGDDLILPLDSYEEVVSALGQVGLKTNLDKCCTHGPFRESCGMDAYHGHPVTPLRFRKRLDRSRNPGSLASNVALSNALWRSGFLQTAQTIFQILQKTWRDSIPVVVNDNEGGIAFVRKEWSRRERSRFGRWRFNRHLQRTEVRSFSIKPHLIEAAACQYALMLRVLTDYERDVQHHDRAADRLPTGSYPIVHRDKLTRTWTPAAR